MLVCALEVIDCWLSKIVIMAMSTKVYPSECCSLCIQHLLMHQVVFLSNEVCSNIRTLGITSLLYLTAARRRCWVEFC